MIKKTFAYLILAVSVITSVLMGGQPVQAATTIEQIQDKGTFVVGTSADYPPYEFHAQVDGSDQIIGMDISFAQAIADELGVELEVRDLGFDALLPALETGSVDAVIAGMTPTREREKSVDFSDLYYIDQPAIVTLKRHQDKFGRLEDLAGEPVGAQTGSLQADYLEKIEGAEPYLLSDINQLVIALQTEKISALVLTYSTARIYQENRDDLHIYDPQFQGGETEGYAVAFPKGSEDIIQLTNQVIEEAEANNSFDQWLQDVIPYVEFDEEASQSSFLSQYWPYFWSGTKWTILISIIGVLFGVILGVILALMRLSNSSIISFLGSAYVEFVRGTPLLIQVMFIYFGLGMVVNIPALLSGIIALSLNSGAYVAEIIRSGLNSVAKGQSEASRSLGLSYGQSMRHIVFPQALRNIWPALGNEFVTIIKESSIISTIGVAELTFQTNIVQTQSYKGILPLFISMILYFILTFTLTKILNYYESKLQY